MAGGLHLPLQDCNVLVPVRVSVLAKVSLCICFARLVLYEETSEQQHAGFPVLRNVRNVKYQGKNRARAAVKMNSRMLTRSWSLQLYAWVDLTPIVPVFPVSKYMLYISVYSRGLTPSESMAQLFFLLFYNYCGMLKNDN